MSHELRALSNSYYSPIINSFINDEACGLVLVIYRLKEMPYMSKPAIRSFKFNIKWLKARGSQQFSRTTVVCRY